MAAGTTLLRSEGLGEIQKEPLSTQWPSSWYFSALFSVGERYQLLSNAGQLGTSAKGSSPSIEALRTVNA